MKWWILKSVNFKSTVLPVMSVGLDMHLTFNRYTLLTFTPNSRVGKSQQCGKCLAGKFWYHEGNTGIWRETWQVLYMYCVWKPWTLMKHVMFVGSLTCLPGNKHFSNPGQAMTGLRNYFHWGVGRRCWALCSEVLVLLFIILNPSVSKGTGSLPAKIGSNWGATRYPPCMPR